MVLVQPTRLRELTQDPRTVQQALSPTDKERRGARSGAGPSCGCWTCRMGGDQGLGKKRRSPQSSKLREVAARRWLRLLPCDYYPQMLTLSPTFLMSD